MTKQEKFQNSIYNLNFELFKRLLNDKEIDITYNDNEAIRYLSYNGCSEFVTLLLEHPSVEPQADRNDAIIIAHCNGYEDTVKLLWKHKKVKETLIKDDGGLYHFLIEEDKKNKIKKIKDF